VPRPEEGRAAEHDLNAVLRRVAGRQRMSVMSRSAAAGGFGWAIAVLLLGGRSWLVVAPAAGSLALLIFCTLAWRNRRAWTAAAAAAALERSQPESRNLIITADELFRHPDRARPWVRARVMDEAAAIAQASSPVAAVPLRRDVALALMALISIGVVSVGVPQRAAAVLRDAAQRATERNPPVETGLARLIATLVPPPYLAMPERTLENPDRLDAIAGSRLKLEMTGSGSLRVRFGLRPLATSAGSAGTLVAEMVLTESGYLAIDDPSSTGGSALRLVAVAVTPDRAPVIRIDQPGKDLLVADARPTVPVVTSASDDFGLRSLELRYTKVSGSGEQFEFEEGSVPLALARPSGREWKGQAALALSGLELRPGDSVVYRVVGRDARPGDAGLASSDTYFIEVAGPGQVSLAGFELPPDRERYALSQQMVVLKIQRLRARELSMSRPAVTEEAQSIAAEQRAVRGNFIFLTGGQVENEEEEAAHSHEIQEGRLENTARREIGIAIQHMSRADQALVAVDTAAALAAARAAVEALQRAFGRNRYILRTLPVRSRIDASRRLSGDLGEAADAARGAHAPTQNTPALATRRLLAQLIDLNPALISSGPHKPTADLTSMAEDALSVDAGSDAWQQVSRDLLSLRDLASAGRREQTAAKLDELVAVLIAEARKHAIPAGTADRTDQTLRSAWAGERHR
jgi:hypothetical protein